MILVLLCALLFIGIFSFISHKEPAPITVEDIFESNDYTVLWQSLHPLILEIPKERLPADIYTPEGHVFPENEVIAFQTATSNIYLESVHLTENQENLVFQFNISHNLTETGAMLTRDCRNEDGTYEDGLRLWSTSLWDDTDEFEDALSLQGFGDAQHFSFYVSTDACRAASGTLKIKIYCTETVYEKNFYGEKKQLTLDDLLKLSRKGQELSWEDFRPYEYYETGSGFYIRAYPIDDMFQFGIAGVPGAQVTYMHLFANDNSQAYIDVRTGDVAAFIEEHRENPVIQICSTGYFISPVGYSERAFTKMLELGGVPKDMISNSMQSVPFVTIRSADELDAFLREMNSIMDFSKSYSDVFSFTDALDRYYEQEYFSENTLFLLYLTEPNSSNRPDMSRVYTSGDTLLLNISREVYDVEGPAEGWLIPVSVNNADLSKVSHVKAHVRNVYFYNREIEKIYQFEESTDLSKPTICLMNDGTFEFHFSSYSSYLGTGVFELNNERLTLRTGDGKYVYVFDVTDDHIVFDANASSDMTWHSNLYDKAVLQLQ